MLTFVHSNPALVRDGLLHVDRKFLTGMLRNAETIDAPITTVHPTLEEPDSTMDLVAVPCASLPFKVLTAVPGAAPDAALRAVIRASELIYGTLEWGVDALVREARVPYVMVVEYDLQTQAIVTSSQVTNPLRKLVRKLRCTAEFHRRAVPQMRRATALHCNGFPVYDESARYNDERLLYLDSRMSADMVISEAQLQARLAARRQRGRARLLYSGRYEPMKGSIDAVKVAIECLRRGLDIEFHSYGQGGLRDDMRALAAQSPAPERIVIHDAIPYPELVERSRDFDAFVSCHVQSDPSCTYLESLGSGLPIVGYANRMWSRLVSECGCGEATAIGDPAAAAGALERLLADGERLDALSLRARRYALEHTFEREFALRTNALNHLLHTLRGGSAPKPRGLAAIA